MSGFFQYGGEADVRRLGRAVQEALSQDGVVVQSAEAGRLLTVATTDLIVVGDVRAPQTRLERVSCCFDAEVGANRTNYWTMQPFYMDDDRVLHEIGDAVTTERRTIAARALVEWDGLSQALEVEGGVLIRFTPTGTPTTPHVTGTAQLRRGV